MRVCKTCKTSGRFRPLPDGRYHLHELEPGDEFEIPGYRDGQLIETHGGRAMVRWGDSTQSEPCSNYTSVKPTGVAGMVFFSVPGKVWDTFRLGDRFPSLVTEREKVGRGYRVKVQATEKIATKVHDYLRKKYENRGTPSTNDQYPEHYRCRDIATEINDAIG